MNLDDSNYRKHLFLLMNLRILYWFKNKKKYMNNMYKYMENYIGDEKVNCKNLKSFSQNIIKNLINENTEIKLNELFSIRGTENNSINENINIIIPNLNDLEIFIKFCQIKSINFQNCNIHDLYKNYFEYKKNENIDNKFFFEDYKEILKEIKSNYKEYEENKLEEKNLSLKELINFIKKLNLKNNNNDNANNKYKKMVIANKIKRLLNQLLLKLN